MAREQTRLEAGDDGAAAAAEVLTMADIADRIRESLQSGEAKANNGVIKVHPLIAELLRKLRGVTGLSIEQLTTPLLAVQVIQLAEEAGLTIPAGLAAYRAKPQAAAPPARRR